MKPKLIGICAILVALLSGASLSAHHAFSADYDAKKVVTVKGRIVNVRWANPHVMIELETSENGGRSVRWVLEGGSLPTLTRAGVRRQDFAFGDVLAACGYGSKNSRPDGVIEMAAEQIMFENGERFKISSYGIDTCLQSTAVTPAPMAAAMPERETSPVGRLETPLVPPFVNAPVTGFPVFGRGTLPRSELRPSMPTSSPEIGDLTLYDRSKSIHFSGKVTAVDLLHPNSYIFVNALGESWVIETSRIQLEQSIVSPAVRVGDTITVTGYFPEEFPNGPLPARFYPPAASYLRTQHLVRAGEITLFSGQKIGVGEPPTREELERRRTVCMQVGC
jgi:hypothetical protein